MCVLYKNESHIQLSGTVELATQVETKLCLKPKHDYFCCMLTWGLVETDSLSAITSSTYLNFSF